MSPEALKKLIVSQAKKSDTASHATGVAIDIKEAGATKEEVKELLTEIFTAIVDQACEKAFDPEYDHHSH